jgi:iron complex outermembrane receptor protein
MLSIALGSALCSGAWAQEAPQLVPVIVVGESMPSFGAAVGQENLSLRRFATNDTAALLDGMPGLSLYMGGGVSSLPVIHGLADDRLKIVVDGMSITAACPNHMNPALSYIDPAAIGQINVYAGIVPVSQGGDSIGGAIIVRSTPPAFAQAGEGLKTSGNVSAFHRSNRHVNGVNAQVQVASENFSLGYVGNTVDAGNYQDGNGQVVGASRYKVRNNAIKLAALSESSDLYTLDIGWQDIPVQGFPNQAMDMTSNQSLTFNAGYKTQLSWGELEARAFRQRVRHKMDLLPEKSSGQMPMDTDALDLGYSLVGTMQWSERQIARFGHEFHRYTLDDWWPPLSSGFMAPHDFWNIRDGRRDRLAVFAELDTQVSHKLSTQLGARLERVGMNTGDVQGYHSAADPGGFMGMMRHEPYSDVTYKNDADAFNAKGHKRTDLNWDLTATARYVESPNETYDLGFSRKTRSPNLHERYTWSNEAMMAGLMNNWFGDLNSYVGNLDLKPEVAYSLKASADWHDTERRDWQLKVAPFYTYVKGYINAVANTSSNPYNMSMLAGRQSLTFANQDAQLYGLDISGRQALGKARGEWAARAALSYTRGKTTGGDNLYNIMPLNARLALDHAKGAWSNTLEAVFVSAKDKVSAVRAEQATAAYSIANFRTSYKLNKSVRLDAGIDNLFNRQYSLPLGGLEYASGGMMTAAQALRAMGRSVNMGVSVSF